MNITVTMSIGHDATDPSALDTTMDTSDLILEALGSKFTNVRIVERSTDQLILMADIDIADPAKYHVED